LRWTLAVVVTLLAACLPAVLWPGDVSWMNDEPNLIAHAFRANEHHALAAEGLLGSFGIKYGPLPTQVYQAMLLVTHDPVKLVAIHALLCSTLTALALLWLARTLRLTPWFAAAVLLAPYLWLYQRTLWDATFTIPLGALALAAYASFLRTGSGKSLMLAVGCAVAMPFIHPQALPLTAAILGHLWWRRRAAVRQHRVGLAIVIALVAALNAEYVVRTTYGVVKGIGWFVWTGHGSHTSRLVAALSPFLAGHLLAGDPFAREVSHLDQPGWAVAVASILSRIILPLMWVGVAIVGWRQWRLWRERRSSPRVGRRSAISGATGGSTARARSAAGTRAGKPPVAPKDYIVGSDDDYPADRARTQDPRDAVRDSIFGIALAALAMYVVLYAALGVPSWLGYTFAPFVLTVLFAWAAVDALARVRLRAFVIAAYGASVAFITVGSMLRIHQRGWDRGVMSPTLANQVEVARGLNRYADPSALTDVPLYQDFPHALRCLRLLLPPDSGQPRPTSGRLLIRYRQGSPTDANRVELVELSPGVDLPDGAKPVDVTPLP
jgi:hypothetical protein